MITSLRFAFFLALIAVGGRALTISHRRSDLESPVVEIAYAAYQGALEGNVQKFLGISYAQPPVGDLRLRRPLPIPRAGSSKPFFPASNFSNSCPQQNYTLSQLPGIDYSPLRGFVSKVKSSEDCLYLNVFRPVGISADAKLPVVVWIYGGGFSVGDASVFNATTLVSRSVRLGNPVIYVSFNYRVNGFGFLAGKEVKEAGVANLGIHDQRLALAWVQEFIEKFGGDPKKVTLWGQSAGSGSITTHLVTHPDKEKTPFRGAVMHSIFSSPTFATDHPKHQAFYDSIVENTGCSGQNSTLDCLRKVPFDKYMGAVNKLPSLFSNRGLNLTFGISVDGNLLNKTLKTAYRDGEFSSVPLMLGSNDDEGTIFSIPVVQDVGDDAQFRAFITKYYVGSVNSSTVDRVMAAYPADHDFGSPFETSAIQYPGLPQYKRTAAFQGDFIVGSARRAMLEAVSKVQGAFVWLWKREKSVKYLGSVHGGELPEFYGVSGVVTDNVALDSVLSFVNFQNPIPPKENFAGSLLHNMTWPKWGTNRDQPPVFLFSDVPHETYGLIHDTYRKANMELLTQVQVETGV
ncbi:carotenoid ester lipase precursor [Thelephora ganbajun]|uniref:Carotenoid ester lipase n=1 Tax=Thelephora ganbajun TaxID=370292 RepID=A0ACB6Z9W1_THEGA|nr:carotenoid ester lipase precursor [Thelephora ganbajun]